MTGGNKGMVVQLGGTLLSVTSSSGDVDVITQGGDTSFDLSGSALLPAPDTASAVRIGVAYK